MCASEMNTSGSRYGASVCVAVVSISPSSVFGADNAAGDWETRGSRAGGGRNRNGWKDSIEIVSKQMGMDGPH